MFKSLKRNLISINIAAFLIIITCIFSLVYFITYSALQSDINDSLDKAIDTPTLRGYREILNNTDDGEAIVQNEFWIVIDEDQEIINTNIINYQYLNLELVESLIEETDLDKDYENVKVYDEIWSYKVRETNSGYRIAFLNSTDNYNLLRTLAFAFIVVLIISIIFIFVFSAYFAEKAIKPIKKSFDKQKRFVSDASHELKTPLTVINANLDLVLSNKRKTIKSQEKWLMFIKDETKRLTKLTNDLLSLSKIENNENITNSDLNFSKLLENTVLPYEAVVFDNKIELLTDIEKNIFVLGNRDQLKQVIINLMDNAIKYNVKKGNISISLSSDSSTFNLTIANTSDNIDDKDLTNIFDRFYRVDESRNRNHGGHGLGLAIVKTIIDNHKGKIKMIKEDNIIKVILSFDKK